MNHIVESIGSWGVRSTPVNAQPRRYETVVSGDWITPEPGLDRYPFEPNTPCRVSEVHGSIVHFCCQPGSAFLFESGQVSISGGPFDRLPRAFLSPTHTLREGSYWNWGGNTAGAGQGIYYKIARPVFSALAHPNEFKVYTRSGVESRRGWDAFVGQTLEELSQGSEDPAEWGLLYQEQGRRSIHGVDFLRVVYGNIRVRQLAEESQIQLPTLPSDFE